MKASKPHARIVVPIFVLGLLVFEHASVAAAAACTAEQTSAQVPTDLALCASLEQIVRKPGALPLATYEEKLGVYLRHFCHRNRAAGWRSDKHIRDTGPFTFSTPSMTATAHDFGTHAPVIVWYSSEMLEWLRGNRHADVPETQAGGIPDGAMMIKEMYPAPAAVCAEANPERLLPTNGAAVMVRDNKTARDGWFWGWFGWEGWTSDWPALASSPYPTMGYGQYCVNCHASARDNQTFSSLRNIEGESGDPLVYLIQGRVPTMGDLSQHQAVTQAGNVPATTLAPRADPAFLNSIGLSGPPPVAGDVHAMPSMAYDHVWAKPDQGKPGQGATSGLVTSDQCLGCHDAGSTGLQFDMTAAGPDGRLVNLSPYGTWRSSPMGMAGRDPIFLAQLASETDSFHPTAASIIQDTCLGCHGVLGQRALKATRDEHGACKTMSREMLRGAPFPDGDPLQAFADYAGLARDGVSCVACHRMAFGEEAAKAATQPQNACLGPRRDFLTPGLSGIAATFTGSFALGATDVINGPFKDPRVIPMEHALGMRPHYNPAIESSELCGTCHTVHLPILKDGKVLGHTYEQTTYAEWAFSAYRTGATPEASLPLGPGSQAQSCQGCHMPSRDSSGALERSKIASIQEFSNFPQAENNLPPRAIDLPVRDGFARHTLVGLNLVFVEMAAQYPEILGLRTSDPMLGAKAVDPLEVTKKAMLDQANGRTAGVVISDLSIADGMLRSAVRVTNKTGHKFPSGVGFRRAFIEFSALDAEGHVLWRSGRTNGAGVILDAHDQPLDGELWWQPDCSARVNPEARTHQPHHQTISREDEVQIYEDLAAGPSGATPVCNKSAPAQGPLTTSFMSRCTKVKDNRLLPAGFLDVPQRTRIALALGAEKDLAEDAGPTAVGDDPDYVEGGGDTLLYRIPLTDVRGRPVAVRATLYYQSTPPYYLQDRACTSRSSDAKRLQYLAANLVVAPGASSPWKLEIAVANRMLP